MDRTAGELGEQVVMQIGSTNYEPKNCDYFRFIPRNDIEELYARARLVVCHAGSGSILTVLKQKKPFVLVPRMKRYGEVFDDHQIEIAREMERRGVTVVYDMSNLESAVGNVNLRAMEFTVETTLVRRLKEYLDEMEK